jgi:TetR/AcrR family transcriptional regulator, transcriptional repressor of bet genes
MAPAAVDHDVRRDRLSAVLLEVVAEGGLEAASIRAIAARAGVAIGTVQHYFPTKDDMLRHAYRRVGEDLGARAEERANAAPTPKAALREVLLELLPIDARREAAVRISIAFAARALHAPALAAELRDDLAELHEAIAGILEAGGAQHPEREARLAVAVAGGLSEPLLFGDEAFTPADAVAALDAHLDRAFSG